MQQAPRRKGRRSHPSPLIGRDRAPTRVRTLVVSAFTSTVMVAALLQVSTAQPAAAASVCTPMCQVTVRAFDPAFPNANPGVGAGLGKGAAISTYNFIINADNTRLPLGAIEADGSTTGYAQANGYAPTESNSPIVAEGTDARNTVNLPTGRYLITVRAPGHKMWGQLISLPRDADTDGTANDGHLNADIVLTEASEAKPLPLGSNRVIVFNDNNWTNGAPDADEQGLAGFKVEMYESTKSAVTVDYHNNPLCSDPLPTDPAPGNWPNCETDSDGFAQVDNLSPATYFTEIVPPAGPCNSNPDSQWYQTTTIDGGLELQTPVEEGASGAGPPTALAADLAGNGAKKTINWFGFVCAPVDIANPGTGEITGTARNIQPWTSALDTSGGEAVANPFVSLSDLISNETIYVGQGDSDGKFDIQGVPAGTYNMAIWDEQLSYIITFLTATVGDGEVVDVNTDLNTDPNKVDMGVGVPRWFGWLDGTVYKDVNGNRKYDDGIDTPIPNTDVDQRWRDGSIKESTITDPNGHYEYPNAEGGTLNKFIINEQGFSRFSAYPGPSLHDEQDPNNPDKVLPACAPGGPYGGCLPVDQGGALLSNQLLQPDHRVTVDWGKTDYPAGTPGQIVGVTYFATTRNEFRARNQAHEVYEPAVPDVTVLLEGLGVDGLPNTPDDVVLNKYVTDHWQHPTSSQDPAQTCKLIDGNGNDVTGDFNHLISDKCIEQPITGVQTKDGAFDGGYAFADYCPESTGGYNLTADDGTCADGSDPVSLVAGTYITHMVVPSATPGTYASSLPCNPDGNSADAIPQAKYISGPFGNEAGAQEDCLYRPVREDDVNVDLGAAFTPAIPPPPCVGDDHLIDQTTVVDRSPFFGDPTAHANLCDKVLITLQNGQNFNADFNLMTNFPTDPNGSDPLDTRIGDVAEPGRIIGISLNDLKFETDPTSVLFGDNAGAPGLPVGIYGRYDDNPNHWRLFTTVETSDIGTYEALLPSTETLNCPIPQGPCPGMYRFLVDDPGTPNHPNANYDPSYIRGTDYIFDVWPGQTDDSLDTPMIPATAGSKCETPSGKPELLQVSKPVVLASNTSAASRRITIRGVGFGTTPGTVLLADPRGNNQSRTLGPVVTPNPTLANGGVISWSPTQIVIQVPAAGGSFPAGQKQLSITEDGRTTDNGITIHVLNGGYNPTVVNVAAPTVGGHQLQNAIDAAPDNSLLVLSPGTYYENVVMWHPVKIQGLGVGGTVGARNLLASDPRFAIPGSVISGRFFGSNVADWEARVAAHRNASGPWYQNAASLAAVMRGADVLVLAKATNSYNIPGGPTGVFSAARIDGAALIEGGGNRGAGGVQLQGQGNNLKITNDVLEGNSGTFAGGIGIGLPSVTNNTNSNANVDILFDRVIGNGAASGVVTTEDVETGGVGIFNGSTNYEVGNSLICSNATGEPDSPGHGGGISQFGRSNNGSIHDNEIVYNTAIESGGGISLIGDVTAANNNFRGTGSESIDRNTIQTNSSGNDGGGVFLSGAMTFTINVRNNMINDNLANDMAGAIMLHDSTGVSIINNTVANNGSTASPVIGSSSLTPHSAGLAVDANSPAFSQAPGYSRPAALRNNIFWQNEAFTLDTHAPLATLQSQGYLDFEVFGTGNNTDTLTPLYSDLTNGNILFGDGSTGSVPGGVNPSNAQHNRSGDPKFIGPFKLVLLVGASTADPTTAIVSIAGVNPPDEGLFGDYHIRLRGTFLQRTAQALASQVIDRAPTGNGAPNNDFDGQTRPAPNPVRPGTPVDIGADETTR